MTDITNSILLCHMSLVKQKGGGGFQMYCNDSDQPLYPHNLIQTFAFLQFFFFDKQRIKV